MDPFFVLYNIKTMDNSQSKVDLRLQGKSFSVLISLYESCISSYNNHVTMYKFSNEENIKKMVNDDVDVLEALERALDVFKIPYNKHHFCRI